MSAELTTAWLLQVSREIHERWQWLTELDAAIGDGDHGINLDRGFQAVAAELSSGRWATLDTSGLLGASGGLLLGTVGGASGALYGRALQRAGAALAARASGLGLPPADAAVPAPPGRLPDGSAALALALDAAVDAIAALGHSRPGEKTMLDTLVPAAAALRDAVATGSPAPTAARHAARAGELGAQTTIPLVAMKGRASYLGVRAIGHLDPGAASSALMLHALVTAFERDDRTSGPA